MSMFRYIRLVDRFPHQLTLKANRKEAHSTTLTIFASILLIGFFFLYFPMKMWNYIKDRPFNLNVTFSRLNRLDFKTLHPENMKIMSVFKEEVVVTDTVDSLETKTNLLNPNKERYATQHTFTKDPLGVHLEETPAGDLHYCDHPSIQQDYEAYFKYSKILKEQSSTNICISPHKSIQIGGEYMLSGKFSAFWAKIPYILSYKKPEEGQKYGSCPKMYNSSYFGFVYETNLPKYDLEVPFESSIYSYSWLVENYKYVSVRFILRKIVVTTDTNYLADFVPNVTHEFYSLKEVKIERGSRIDPNKAEKESDCEVDMIYIIEVDDEVLEVTREYEKLDNFIANTTGVIGFISIIFQVLLSYFEGSVFDEELVRNLYYRNDQQKTNFDNHFEKQINLTSDKSSIDKFKTVVISNTRVSTLSKETRTFFCCCRKQPQNTISAKAMKYFEYDSDVLTLVRKSLLLESLVKVLLTNEQVDLMNLINVRPLDGNEDVEKEIRKIEERFPMAGDLNSLTSRMSSRRRASIQDDVMTMKILGQIEKK